MALTLIGQPNRTRPSYFHILQYGQVLSGTHPSYFHILQYGQVLSGLNHFVLELSCSQTPRLTDRQPDGHMYSIRKYNNKL